MANVLEKIAAYKRDEIAPLFTRRSQLEMQAATQPEPRGFLNALKSAAGAGPALIAEIKKASPSKGLIREDFQPTEIARAYTDGGAACLSVLTDEPSFQGSPLYLKQARAISPLPALRKDFMIDPVQIVESRAYGADAILIIMAMVSDDLAGALLSETNRLGMDALVETHTAAELNRAVKLGANFIGINNRNLKTFKTSLETFKRLAPKAPADTFLIAESGINTADDILDLTQHGAQGFLVGESLMRETDVKLATHRLLGQVDETV
ncbi:MAG: indole-3-glycerol phosphate synthase TrpC [Robiginitomaculum sp.]|nr:indole-3-glycerol phosphate synthase TrpC [Robiginitomaculum sp.]